MNDPLSGDQRSKWPDECQDWARKVLDIPAAAGDDDVRHAILTRLEESQFVPPAPWDQAVHLLADPRAELRMDDEAGHAFFHAMEADLHGQLVTLSREFFDLPPHQRRERWTRMAEKADFSPPIRAHLEWLKPALDVEIARETAVNPQVQELIDHFAATHALPAPMRAAAGVLFLERARCQPKAWRKAAKQLRRLNPGLAAIGSGFLAAVAEGAAPARRQALPPGANRPWIAPPPTNAPTGWRRWFPLTSNSTSSESGQLPWGILVAIIIAVSSMGRMASERSPNNKSYYPSPVQQRTFDNYSQPEPLRGAPFSYPPQEYMPPRDIELIPENGRVVVRNKKSPLLPGTVPFEDNRPRSPFELAPVNEPFGHPSGPSGYQPFAPPAPGGGGGSWRPGGSVP